MGAYLTSRKIEVYMSGVWADITARVVSDLEADQGFFDDSYDNRLASPGIIRFSMNNADGIYTPSATFKKGIPFRVQVTYAGYTITKFFGHIDQISVDEGTFTNQRVHITALDWLDYATKQLVRQRPVETNRYIHQALATLISDVPIAPLSTFFESGTQLFPSVFDSITKNSTIYSELNNLIMSEYCYGYMDQGGQRFHVESNISRKGLEDIAVFPLDGSETLLLENGTDELLLEDGVNAILLEETEEAIFNNTFRSLKVIHGSRIINEAVFTVYPRRVDTSTAVLFTLQWPVLVPTAEFIELVGYFSDPTGGNRVHGISFIDPVATTDYMMFANEDGTGTNLTANLAVTPIYEADRVTYRLYNTGAPGYVTFLRQRGFGIYTYNPLEVLAEDEFSKQVHGVEGINIRQAYQQSITLASFEAAKMVDIEKDPRMTAIEATFLANTNDYLMKAFLFVDIGRLIKIQCTKPAIDDYFFINGIKWKIGVNGIITFTFILKDLVSTLPIAIKFSGVVSSQNAVQFGIVPRIASLSQFTITAWVYITSLSSNFPIMSNYGGVSGGGWYWFIFTNGKIDFRHQFTTQDGIWDSTSDIFSSRLNAWHHIALSFNNSSAASDPVLYVDGASVSITESTTPSGVAQLAPTSQFMLGNMKASGDILAYSFQGLQKDVRVYDRILSAEEIAEIEAGENDYSTVPNGLILQGVFVRDFRWSDYVGDPILPHMKVLDRLYELPGTVIYNTANISMRVEGRDPSLTSY